MTEKSHQERAVGRRKDDLHIRDLIWRYRHLVQIGQTLTSEINMDRLFELIMDIDPEARGLHRLIFEEIDGFNG